MSREPGEKRPIDPDRPRPGSIREGAETFQPAKKGPTPTPQAANSTPIRPKSNRPGQAPPKEPRPVSGGPNVFEKVVFGSVSSGHLATFCRQFAAYLDAGVDLIKALDSLRKQFAGSALGPIIGRLSTAIRRGETVADACAREPKAFDHLFLSMVKVAEARGGLPETLRRMGEHYEARQRLIRQARSALIYPTIVLLVAGSVVALLTIFVLPKLVDMLESVIGKSGASLPGPTRLLIGISHFVSEMGWWAIPVGLGGSIFGLILAYRTAAGKAALDEVALYVPVLGSLLTKIDIARMSRTLSDLLAAGVDYGQSLDMTADVLHLTPFRRALRGSRVLILEGTELSVALGDTKRFPIDVISIVESGEETGRLPETLDKLADDYEEQVSVMVKSLGSLIQPIIMLGLGGIIAFIAIAFIMAYASIISGLSGG